MLRVRPYKNSDAKLIVGWISDEKEFRDWSAEEIGEYPFDEEQMECLGRTVPDDDRLFQFVFYEQDSVIAYLAMNYFYDDCRVFSFKNLILDPAQRRKGKGKEVLELAKYVAFELFGVSRIVTKIPAANCYAYDCFKSAGFWDSPTEIKDLAGAFKKLKDSMDMNVTASNVENDHASGISGDPQISCKMMETYPQSGNMYQDVSVEQEEKMINEILEKNSFLYAFQPIVEASTGRIFGYEALMRAEYDGLISPNVILENAEKYHKLYEIEKASFFNSMEIATKQPEIFENRKVFINSIPGYLLKEEDYLELLNRFGEDLSGFVVEITESTELAQEEWTLLQQRSENQHFELAIDDYGTGYANTTNLLKHMPNYVKIDRLLITDINEDDKKQHFVKSMIDFAHANGFMTLAEGVETSAELRTVVQMGIDLLQGYYLARPAFDILDEIDEKVRQELMDMGIRGQAHQERKILQIQNGEKELPLMRIALEQNTGILISQPEFTLIGNTNYTAVMTIKIKDGCNCRLTIQNVFLESFQELPCIEVGKNSHLTLVLEGENKLQKTGICVPEGSSLTIEGAGNLQIRSQGIQSFGIGNNSEASFGSIILNGTGSLDVLVEADEGVGIGGGWQHEGQGIKIMSGIVRVEPASERAVGIGSFEKTVPVEIGKAMVQVDLRVAQGIGIGCGNDDLKLTAQNAKISVLGSGSTLSGIGSNKKSGGSVSIHNSELNVKLNGQLINLVGCGEGALAINMEQCQIELCGEGAEVLGLGSRDHKSSIFIKDSDCDITIRSSKHMMYGAEADRIVYEGGNRNCMANA